MYFVNLFHKKINFSFALSLKKNKKKLKQMQKYYLNDLTYYECESRNGPCKLQKPMINQKNQSSTFQTWNPKIGTEITIANNETCQPMEPLFVNLNEEYGLHLTRCPMVFQVINGSSSDVYRLQNPDGLFFRSDLLATSNIEEASEIQFEIPFGGGFGPRGKLNLYRTDPFTPYFPPNQDRRIRFQYPECAGSPKERIFNFVICYANDQQMSCLTNEKLIHC